MNERLSTITFIPDKDRWRKMVGLNTRFRFDADRTLRRTVAAGGLASVKTFVHRAELEYDGSELIDFLQRVAATISGRNRTPQRTFLSRMRGHEQTSSTREQRFGAALAFCALVHGNDPNSITQIIDALRENHQTTAKDLLTLRLSDYEKADAQTQQLVRERGQFLGMRAVAAYPELGELQAGLRSVTGTTADNDIGFSSASLMIVKTIYDIRS